jgi:hypothetical protein
MARPDYESGMSIPRKLSEAFVETEVDGEVLIVDLEGGELFSLAETAGAIWRLIDGKRDLSGIVEALMPDFDACTETIGHDCQQLLDELVDAGLVSFEQSLR